MKVQEIITTTKSIELNVTGVTLLTTEEAQNLSKKLLRSKMSDAWWLRSPGRTDIYAACVFGEHSNVYANGLNVDQKFGVRPALEITNLKSSNITIGDEFKVFNYVWTAISETKVLCNDIIGFSPFRKDWKSVDANDYEKSDVKKYLEDWYSENIGRQ